VKECANEVVTARELAWFRAEAGLVFAQGRKIMSTLGWIILIVVLLFLFGGGGFYWSRRRG
jgi:hypothetical protein